MAIDTDKLKRFIEDNNGCDVGLDSEEIVKEIKELDRVVNIFHRFLDEDENDDHE